LSDDQPGTRVGELLGLSSILGSLAVAYWFFAAACIALALYLPKDKRKKTVAAIAAVIVFGVLPAKSYFDKRERDAYAAEAWAYFKKLCSDESGEKIYKRFSGVKSVFVTKPLAPASEKDLFDQFWNGDPYSNATPHSGRAESAAWKLASKTLPVEFGKRGNGFEFVESIDPLANQESVKKYWEEEGKERSERITLPTSRFAISWEDRSTALDRKYWIARSHLTIVDQTTGDKVAERIGFQIEPGFGSTGGHRRPWLAGRGPRSTCPEAHDFSDRWFLLKVLRSNEG
jgi:hypothetical protein